VIISRVIDNFINQVGKRGSLGKRGLNLTQWYEMVAFDVLGEMAFGESFGCIDSGKYNPFPAFVSF
jgi:hypothetical protein